EIGPPGADVAVVVAQVAYRFAELGEVAQLIQGVPGVTGQRAEQVRPQHRRDHRAESAGGLAADRPVRPVSQRADLALLPGQRAIPTLVPAARWRGAGPGGEVREEEQTAAFAGRAGWWPVQRGNTDRQRESAAGSQHVRGMTPRGHHHVHQEILWR